MSEVTVGIDWGAQEMSVCALDEAGKRLLKKDVARTGEKIEGLVERLLALVDGDPKRLKVALEMPRASVIEALLARGVSVYTINPKQADRFRDRHTISGAKDDSLDAFVLADALRSDTHLFRLLRIEPEDVVLLRERSRAYEELTGQAVALGNQLHALLSRYYKEIIDLGVSLHETPWVWRLIQVAPNADKLRAGKTTTVLKRLTTKKGPKLPQDILARLEAARRGRPLPMTRATRDALTERVQRLLPILRATHRQRRECQAELRKLVNQLTKEEDESERPSDMAILMSMPGIGYRIASVLFAEASRAIQERKLQPLRRLAGIAPVSRRSGGRAKTPVVSMRRAAHRRLRDAVHNWMGIAIRYDERARALYERQRAKGNTYARALRAVADRMLAVLVAALRERRLYDESQRRLPAPS